MFTFSVTLIRVEYSMRRIHCGIFHKFKEEYELPVVRKIHCIHTNDIPRALSHAI